MNQCSVEDMKGMVKDKVFDKYISPRAFHDGDTTTPVSDWTELSLIFVHWLLKYGHLSLDKLPIPNHAGRGKYLINNKPCHQHPGKDGEWKKVNVYYFDRKYNAEAHIKNMIKALQVLKVKNPDFRVSFRPS
jgi:hypothetical protein